MRSCTVKTAIAPGMKPSARCFSEMSMFNSPGGLLCSTSTASIQSVSAHGRIRLEGLSGALAAHAIDIDHNIGDGDAEGRATVVLDECDLAAMGLDQLCRDGETETGSAFARHALKCLEEMRPCLLRHAGSGVADFDDDDGAFAARQHHDLAAAAAAVVAVERLYSIAGQICQHAIKLVAVGIDLEFRIDIEIPGNQIRTRQPQAVADLADKRAKRKALAVR